MVCLNTDVDKPNSKKQQAVEEGVGSLVLFAESGPGLEDVTVDEVQQWHQPKEQWKKDLSLYKYLKYQVT